MAEHPTNIPGFDTLDDAADYIGNLRYDALTEFLGALELKLMRDSEADQGRNRPLLSGHLHEARMHLGHARISTERAWGISARHMLAPRD
jgi:hypothetical protein